MRRGDATELPRDDQVGDEERPKKKQKTAPQVKPANIIKLAVSPNQQHAVAVTDDKHVRVFSLFDGNLVELSQRCMPKRPCAIQVLPENTTIICGDKFGDVYSLPLLPETATEVDTEPGAAKDTAPEADTGKPAFKPSATNLTVHTQRNRKALEAQMQQKAFSAKKEALQFEHKLLLGHVSMLTDVAYATRKVDGRERGYILTADRDEHIRISRGPPQSHVIEGYCLGHKEFVSKLCLVPGMNLLISGGGENELYVWEWPSCTLKRTIPLYDAMLSMQVPGSKESYRAYSKDGVQIPSGSGKNLAISGLWTVPCQVAGDKKETVLMVAVERMPGLYIMPTNWLPLTSGEELGLTLLDLEYPPLDVACTADSVIVSLDAREEGQARVRAYQLRHAEGQKQVWRVECTRDEEFEKKLQCANTRSVADTGVGAKALDDLLYGVANLRKRRGWGDSGKAGDDELEGGAGMEDAPED
ncbi:hypothetical protein B0A55_03060 [Friedmanniomyces simplex]|uniref:Uncharacterized protein n=1 Tax=Friedmanniomyces simplex TaxID=329884 RepID=A0A4V5NHC2_9PEZI|nr:hypothetical protein B0A55_03060 [Friedmanniomyces simplex]